MWLKDDGEQKSCRSSTCLTSFQRDLVLFEWRSPTRLLSWFIVQVKWFHQWVVKSEKVENKRSVVETERKWTDSNDSSPKCILQNKSSMFITSVTVNSWNTCQTRFWSWSWSWSMSIFSLIRLGPWVRRRVKHCSCVRASELQVNMSLQPRWFYPTEFCRTNTGPTGPTGPMTWRVCGGRGPTQTDGLPHWQWETGEPSAEAGNKLIFTQKAVLLFIYRTAGRSLFWSNGSALPPHRLYGWSGGLAAAASSLLLSTSCSMGLSSSSCWLV